MRGRPDTSSRPRTKLAEQFGRQLRAARGATPRRELARRLGLHPTTLFAWERGGPDGITLDRVERAAEAYGVDVEIVVRPRA